MIPARIRIALGVAVAAAVIVVAVLSVGPARPLVGPKAHSHPPVPVRPGRNYPGVLVPKSGAYLGAYVQPHLYTSAGEIRAYLSFEHELGSPLEIVHVYNVWGTTVPTSEDRFFVRRGKILLLTWGGDVDTPAIIAGRDDAMIRATADRLKALGRPILLEFRHEMDRPNLQYTVHGPADYIAAWDHIRAIFSAVGAANVGWVWCPTGYGFQVGRAQRFYPGDKEVDWVCADVYSATASEPLSYSASTFLSWASHHDKPVLIGEFATGGNPSTWAPWLAAAGKLVETDRQIKGLVYFDGNGTDSNGRPFFYRLDNHSVALSAFAGLLQQPFFRPAAPNDP